MQRRTPNPAAVAGLLTLAALVSMGSFVDPVGSASLGCSHQQQLLGVSAKDESATWLGALTDAARSLHGGDRWQRQFTAAILVDPALPDVAPAPADFATRAGQGGATLRLILVQRQLIDLPPPPAA